MKSSSVSSAATAVIDSADVAHMRATLSLAARGLGRVAPNPAVGCVLVKDSRVVGRGWTQPGGRPHAEAEAIGRAGKAARGATAYVSLEPCAHHGRTPPCADGLIAAGIARCVVAIEDPDHRVGGRGLERLRSAGIAVDVGVCAEEAAELNAGYLLRKREGRPLITLKLATTLDGRIATRTGESRWITGTAARTQVQLLRARHDAILVGSGTAVADDPKLDVQLPGLADRRPIRIVLDGQLRLPLTHDLVAQARERPTWLVTREGSDPARRRAYEDCGVDVIVVPVDADRRLSITASLKAFAARGLTRVLVEGGAYVAATLFSENLVDRIVWFHAPRIIGGDGIPAAAGFGLESLTDTPAFVRVATATVGEDLMETYRRNI